MQRAEIRDGGALLGSALGEVAELARDVHRAVAGRVFGLLGPRVAPVRVLHDAISATAYGSARLGVRSLPAMTGAVAAQLSEPSTASVHDTARGHFLLGALNGFWGDRLAAERASLASVVGLRTHEGRVRRRPGNVAHDAGAEATGRLVVFAHGLCENDRFWSLGAQRHYGERGLTYGSLLRDERGWTPLYLSYNTGLHVSESGRQLADYLEALVSAWPVPVDEIALVGHSMGGLVIRSAAHQAAARELAWVPALRHVVGLGVPHLGAPLERFANVGTHALARLPETRPFAAWLNRRSVGIKDLRYGAVVEADWFGHDPDERLMDRCTPATLLAGVAYSMASATLSRRPDGLLGHDLLVQHVSAHGTGPRRPLENVRPAEPIPMVRSQAHSRRIDFEVDRLFHMGGKHHFDLLGDPLVYEQLRSWLAGADGAAPASATPAVGADE